MSHAAFCVKATLNNVKVARIVMLKPTEQSICN